VRPPAISTRLADRAGRAVRAAVGRPLAWAALVAVVAGWPVLRSVRTALPPPPPVLGVVPRFDLSDEAGRPFGSPDLAGRIWIAGSAGPSDTAALARVQARARSLEPALHLVTFGADPAHRAPEGRAALARSLRASPRMWTFLGPPPDEVRAALGAGGLALVDGASRLRGRYDPSAPEAVDRIVRDAALLVNRR
jgi:protein SCO1/2